jgi:Phorbol esters/diacylglycerol binding domain (C1 domain)
MDQSDYFDDWQRRAKKKNHFVSKMKKHDFKVTTFKKPVWCMLCNEFVWGLRNQGYRCLHCAYVAHGKCLSKSKALACTGEKAKKDNSVGEPRTQNLDSYIDTLLSAAEHSGSSSSSSSLSSERVHEEASGNNYNEDEANELVDADRGFGATRVRSGSGAASEASREERLRALRSSYVGHSDVNELIEVARGEHEQLLRIEKQFEQERQQLSYIVQQLEQNGFS